MVQDDSLPEKSLSLYGTALQNLYGFGRAKNKNTLIKKRKEEKPPLLSECDSVYEKQIAHCKLKSLIFLALAGFVVVLIFVFFQYGNEEDLTSLIEKVGYGWRDALKKYFLR